MRLRHPVILTHVIAPTLVAAVPFAFAHRTSTPDAALGMIGHLQVQ